MLTVFQVCFFAGFGLIVLSFVFGSIFELTGFDGFDLELGFLGLDIFLPVNFTLYLLFSVVFGGVGWLLMVNFTAFHVILICIISAAVGILISVLMNHLVLQPLKKAQNTSAPDLQDLIGVRAVVQETIPAGGYGEIRYVINGNSYSAPAKATNEEEIKSGMEVAICWITQHVFYVAAIDNSNGL